MRMSGVENELYKELSNIAGRRKSTMELWSGSGLFDRYIVVCKRPSAVKSKKDIIRNMMIFFGVSVIFSHKEPKNGKYLWETEG